MLERGRGLRDPWLVLILIFAALLRFQYVTQPLVDWFSWREASTAMMADNLPSNGWNPLWPQVSWTGDDAGYQGREFQILTIFAAAGQHSPMARLARAADRRIVRYVEHIGALPSCI